MVPSSSVPLRQRPRFGKKDAMHHRTLLVLFAILLGFGSIGAGALHAAHAEPPEPCFCGL